MLRATRSRIVRRALALPSAQTPDSGRMGTAHEYLRHREERHEVPRRSGLIPSYPSYLLSPSRHGACYMARFAPPRATRTRNPSRPAVFPLTPPPIGVSWTTTSDHALQAMEITRVKAARQRRAQRRRASAEKGLTERKQRASLSSVGESEAGTAGDQPARAARRDEKERQAVGRSARKVPAARRKDYKTDRDHEHSSRGSPELPPSFCRRARNGCSESLNAF